MPTYNRFVNFAGLMGSPQCYTKFDYVDRMVLMTVAPLVVSVLLAVVGIFHATSLAPEKRTDIRRRYVSCFLMLTYLVLPSVSTITFGMFTCVSVDPSRVDPNMPLFMLNDYSIACNSSRYYFGFVWAIIGILVYPAGVTTLYLVVLYMNRDMIKHKDDPSVLTRRVSTHSVRDFLRSIGYEIEFLHRSYKGKFWYWEVVGQADDCC
jgi:hypothetical protein